MKPSIGSTFTATMGNRKLSLGDVVPWGDVALKVIGFDGYTAVGKSRWYKFEVIANG